MIKKNFRISLAVFLGTIFTTSCTFAGEPTPESLPGISIADADMVKGWLDAGNMAAILDPRKQDDFTNGHLPTAINCPVGTEADIKPETVSATEIFLKECPDLSKTDKSKPIAVYCNGVKCWMSPKTALALKEMGFSKVYWFRTGLPEWKDKGYPLE